MVRPLSFALPLTILAATAVNAQLGDFIKNAFGGVISQKPLVSGVSHGLVAKNTRSITTDNWRSSVNVTSPDPSAPEGDAKEWLFYFTTQPSNATAARNVTFWDGVYNETVYALSTTRSTSKLNFGKIDCSAPAATDLCNSFFLTAASKIPAFYHIATYLNNGTTEIRTVPLYGNVTEVSEQASSIAKVFTEKKWKDVEPWTGVFNPIDGAVKDFTPMLGAALRYYEMLPQWIIILGLSLLGRSISSRMIGNRNTVPPQPERAQRRPPTTSS